MEGAEQPAHDAYVDAIRDEESYLQVDDEKQPTPPEPLDPASILCQFCGKSWEQVPMLFQAKRQAPEVERRGGDLTLWPGPHRHILAPWMRPTRQALAPEWPSSA